MAGKRRSMAEFLDLAEPGNFTVTDGLKRDLPIEKLIPRQNQPRRTTDPTELEQMAATIRALGIIQPIVVRPLDDQSGDRYQIVAGERRWRAAQLAGIETIPALVRDVGDEQAATLGLVENLQRSDLNPIEEAEGYRTLIDRGLSQQTIGVAVGKSVSTVSRSLGMLDLADPVKDALRDGQLSHAHGRVLLSLPKAEQARLAQLAIRRTWNSRQIEQAARKLKQRIDDDTRRGRRARREDPDIAALSERISGHLGAKVEFRNHPTGSGQFVIHYASADECNGILMKLNLLDLASD